MLELRILGLDSDALSSGCVAVDPWCSRHDLRRALVQAAQAYRELERREGVAARSMRLQFRGDAAEAWTTVRCTADDAGCRPPVPIPDTFSTDWDFVVERLRLAHRRWASRRRILLRARYRRRSPPAPGPG